MEKTRLKNNKATEPDDTKTRTSRCTDQQVLPVNSLNVNSYLNFLFYSEKIKESIPMETTESIATLVYSPGISRSLPDECPSSRYSFLRKLNNINVLVEALRG